MKIFENLIATIGSVLFIIIGSVIIYILDFWLFTVIWIVIVALYILLFLNAPSTNTQVNNQKKITSNPDIPFSINKKNSNDYQIFNLKKHIDSAYPSKNGLYPHELLILYNAEKYNIKQKVFPNFYYNIPDTELLNILNSLVARNFLKIGSIEITLKNNTLKQLKDVLKENNLKVSGKKVELISRLIENIPEITLKNYFPDEFYSLTQKGKNELSDNSYIEYVLKKSYCHLDIWEANIAVHKNPTLSIADISWQTLNKECGLHFKNRNFNLYRNTLYAMAEELYDEKKFKRALEFFFQICYWDLNGIYNSYDISETVFELAPAVIGYIEDCTERLDLTINELKEIYNNTLKNINTPYNKITKEESFSIIINELNLKHT